MVAIISTGISKVVALLKTTLAEVNKVIVERTIRNTTKREERKRTACMVHSNEAGAVGGWGLGISTMTRKTRKEVAKTTTIGLWLGRPAK